MNKITCSFLALTVMIISMGHIQAQSPVTIIYQGQLALMDKSPLADVKGNMNVIISNKDETKLCEHTHTFTTDDAGIFTISMTDLVTIFSDASSREIADLQITLTPAEGEDWLPDGKYKVKYHLEKVMADEYKMTRYEGQVLNYSYRLPVWQFSDIYPLAYLRSAFTISFSSDLSDPKEIHAIGQQLGGGLGPQDLKKPAPNRGVKGGYAVGGYNSAKKKSETKKEDQE